jgi:TPR repeat protein
MTAMTLEDSKISDVQYVKNYDEQIGALYEEAKASYIDAPIQTLVSLRSVVHEICKQLYDEYSLKGINNNELALLINKLRSKNVVNRDVLGFISAIKAAGDKAAHKHQPLIKISMDQYREMSVDSTRNFCRLIDALNSTLRNDFSEYIFEPKVASYLEKLAYKVLIDNDKEAKFKVGIALIEQVITSWNDFKSSGSSIMSDNGKISRGIKLVKEAADERHPDAMFEYGVMLASGQFIKKAIEAAKGYLWTAAHSIKCEHNEAKAHYGCLVIQEKNIEEIQPGIDLLEESAEALNPLALTLLSTLYGEGEHVELDVEKSNRLLKEAVSQDYPPALYTYASAKMQENEFELSVELLTKSKNLGYRPASLVLARIYASSTEDHQQAISEYRYYLESSDPTRLDYLEIKFEYAQFKFSLDGEDLESLEEYLNLLVSIYQDDGCFESLMARIENITPSLMEKYSPLLINSKPVEKRGLLAYFCTNGKPYKTQAEVWKNMGEIAKNPSLAISKVYGVHPSHIKRQAQIEKEEALKQQAQIEQEVALKQQDQIAKERKQQASIKRQKDKAKTRKANKEKRKHKR